MPRREIIVRLEDMRKAAIGLQTMMDEIKTEENFLASLAYKMAFERSFEIIGEALYHIRKERPEVMVTHMNKIIGLRHIIAHDYYEINHEILWEVAENKLMTLYGEVLKLIDTENIRLFGTSSPEID